MFQYEIILSKIQSLFGIDIDGLFKANDAMQNAFDNANKSVCPKPDFITVLLSSDFLTLTQLEKVFVQSAKMVETDDDIKFLVPTIDLFKNRLKHTLVHIYKGLIMNSEFALSICTELKNVDEKLSAIMKNQKE